MHLRLTKTIDVISNWTTAENSWSFGRILIDIDGLDDWSTTTHSRTVDSSGLLHWGTAENIINDSDTSWSHITSTVGINSWGKLVHEPVHHSLLVVADCIERLGKTTDNAVKFLVIGLCVHELWHPCMDRVNRVNDDLIELLPGCWKVLSNETLSGSTKTVECIWVCDKTANSGELRGDILSTSSALFEFRIVTRIEVDDLLCRKACAARHGSIDVPGAVVDHVCLHNWVCMMDLKNAVGRVHKSIETISWTLHDFKLNGANLCADIGERF